MSPKLTIILPTFNSMPYLIYSINSILNQKFEHFQLIIVNDGSTDLTREYLRSLTDKRIKIINKKHSGIIDSCNIGFSFADTEFVARADADDYYYPTKFEKQINYLKTNNEIALLGTSANYMSKGGKISNYSMRVSTNHDEIIKNIFQKKRAIIQSTIVLRSEIIHKLKGYREFILPEDYDLYLRIGIKNKISNLTENLAAVRLHSSFSLKNLFFLSKELDKLIDYYNKEYYHLEINRHTPILDNLSIYFNRMALDSYLNGKLFKSIPLGVLGFISNPIRLLNFLNGIKNNLFVNKIIKK